MGRLHERERELAAVEVLLERRGRMLVIEGRSGIGKTSLVEAACARADGLRFRDGKHISFNLMFDQLVMLEQLGLLPAAAPK